MGVEGLFPLLKSIHRPAELKKYAGLTLGVDSYVWLHAGVFGCATAVAQGKPTKRYVSYVMHRVRMLQHFGVTPYMVFDGAYLPSKARTEAERSSKREEKMKRGMELLKAGKAKDAEKLFQTAVDVTPEMARNLIEELKKHNISYLVAPYEADAQLVYLERQGIIDGIISEDSDLLVFGAKRLITKLSKFGECIEVNRRDFAACREVSLTGWTDTDFRRMAILSGCDYLAGIPNVGLKTAHRLIRKHKTPERTVQMLQFDGKHHVSENYLTEFYRAELTFLHQRVFCPKKQEMVMFTEADPSRGVDEMPFIGAHLEPAIAQAIARGDINPITKEPMVVESSPSKSRPTSLKPVSSAAGKPITSYFGGKQHSRIPMGEMDRNCFTIDPQEVAALTQNGLVPRVFPLPRPYLANLGALDSNRPAPGAVATSPRLTRRQSEPVRQGHLRLPPPPAMASRRTSDQGAATSSFTTRSILGTKDGFRPRDDSLSSIGHPRPIKKARLCDDADSNPTGGEDGSKSRWFAKTATNKHAEPHLFSDDSIDEALMSLPDVDGWHTTTKVRKSILIFEEDDSQATARTADSASTENSQAFTNVQSQDTVPSEVSFTENIPESPKQSVDSPTETPARPDIKAFSYSTVRGYSTHSRTDATRRRSEIPTPSSSVSSRRASSIFTPALSASSTPPSTISSRPTPLQRLGVRAMQKRATGPASPSFQRNRVNSVPSPPFEVPKAPRSAMPPVNPSFVPLPKVDLAEVDALNRPCGGSEDLLAPESEGENELVTEEADVEPEAGGEAPARSLDLSRFVFA